MCRVSPVLLKKRLMAQLVKNLTAMQKTPVRFLGGKDPWRRDRLPTPIFLGFPPGSAGKQFACNVGDLGPIPGLGRSPGEGKGYPLKYSGLENFIGCRVHGVAKSQTQLSLFCLYAMKLKMPSHWDCRCLERLLVILFHCFPYFL